MSVDAKDAVPEKKFTRSSPNKPGSGMLPPQARNSASLMGMTIESYYPDDRSLVDTLTSELRADGYGGLGAYYEYRYKVCVLENGTLDACTLSERRNMFDAGCRRGC
ncbi:hypothetical protein GCM10017559_60610 [Streptosporangium longisporum]|uniref:Uncharacterized protein n=1 Tax=Streptosporangium longisporum TaxID=46187 RepID=A0ABP6L0B8_9ACTN